MPDRISIPREQRQCSRCSNLLPLRASARRRLCEACARKRYDPMRHRLPGSYESGKRR